MVATLYDIDIRMGCRADLPVIDRKERVRVANKNKP